MKPLSWLGMKALVLGMVVVSMGTGHNGDAFRALCEVLMHAERVLNTSTISGSSKSVLEHALYGKPGKVLTVQNGIVSVKGNCNGQTNRGLLCTYHNGGYGCFAENLAGALLCTCTPGNGGGRNLCGMDAFQKGEKWFGASYPIDGKKNLFQNVWDQIREKCPHETELKHTIDKEVDELQNAVSAFKGKWKPSGHNALYLGGKPGANVLCSGTSRNDVCAGYYTRRQRQHLPIPWLDTIQRALDELKKESQRETPPSPVSTTTRQNQPGPTPSSSAESAEPEVELSDPTSLTDTAEEEKKEETQTPGTPSPTEHPETSKSRSRRSTTEDPATTSTAPEDTTTTDELEILDPTAAPFPLGDGADILTPLGLFMAASFLF